MHYIRRITGAAALFALAVLWSNLWGQVRDSLQMGLFGGRAVAAYVAAVKVPFEAPQVFTTALAAAMVPVLVELCKQGRSADARRVATGMIGAVAVAAAVLAGVGALCSTPILRHVYYWSAADPTELELAAHLSRLLFPYLLISTVSGVVAASLQSFERFRPLALGQLVPNVVIVGCVLALHRRMGITAQALGVVLGGLAYLLLVGAFYVNLKVGTPEHGAARDRVRWWRLPAVRAILAALAPLLLIGLFDWAGTQLVVIRNATWVQETHPDAIANFQNAYRILQIPQGIFIAALSMVFLPFLSRFAAARDRSGMASAVSSGIRMVLYAVAPTVVLIGSLALPILNVLYRHGRYTEQSAMLAAPLVALMAAYVLFSSAAEVLILSLLALRRVWPLLLVQALTLLASAILSHLGAVSFGLEGIAGAVSLVALINLWLLFLTVRGFIPLGEWQETGSFLWKLGAASAGVWIWITVLKRAYEGSTGINGLTHSLLEVVVGVLVAVAIYAGISEWLRIPEWIVLRGSLERMLGKNTEQAG